MLRLPSVRLCICGRVKLARAIGDDNVRHLLWLRERIGPDLLDMIVVTTGPEAYRREDDVAVVPLALLGA